MAESRVVSRYVKSLLDLAVAQGALEPVHQDMLAFVKVCQENRDFNIMLRSPVIRHEKKRAILEKVFKGKVNPLSLAIMDILTRKNREPLLLPIAKEFHQAYNVHKGIIAATITTAVPMDAGLRAEIEKVVKQITDKQRIELESKVDADLIGGFILNVGDKQIDASIKNRLEKLKMKFTENEYIREF
jgi:F-type H+-transporting ATPase subunit delta